MELDADSEVWNVPLMPGWPPALGLESANLASWGLLWQFFKMGRIGPRRGCFYILTTRTSERVLSNRLAREKKRRRSQRRTNGTFARTSCEKQYTLGAPISKFQPQEMGITDFSLRGSVQTCWMQQRMELLKFSY